jgi:hypothetical protein
MIADSRGYFDREKAEALALQALTYLAGNEEALVRFLGLTGLNPQDLRGVAGDPAFLAGVLDHFLEDEPLLLAFAASAGIRPETVPEARLLLGGRS